MNSLSYVPFISHVKTCDLELILGQMFTTGRGILKKLFYEGVPIMAQQKRIQGCRFDPWPHSAGSGSSTAMSCGVGHRLGSDLVLLWLWRRPAAVALIRPLSWEPRIGFRCGPKKTKKYINKNKRFFF